MSKSGVVLSTKKCAPMDAVSSIEPRTAVPVEGFEERAQEALKSWATAPMGEGVAVVFAQV
jgi:hypothetical protein